MDPVTRARIAGQAGLVTRAQALQAGLSERAVDWRLARGWWTRIHPGVYLTTPGRDDWEVRAVAGLLHAGPGSALGGRSAGHVWGLVTAEPETISIVIPAQRRVRPVEGLTITRSRHLPDRVHPTAWPHRVVAEHTVFDLAQGVTFDRAVSLAARAIGLGIVSADSLLTALSGRRGQSHARPLREALADVDQGSESPAELRYVRDVERAHGLPTGKRQTPIASVGAAHVRRDRLVGVGRRDVEYEEWDLVVEIDGRLGHDGWRARQREGLRDRKAAVGGRLTIRCHWPDLVPTACDLAADVADLLRQRGWTGHPRPCGTGCPIDSAEPAGRRAG